MVTLPIVYTLTPTQDMPIPVDGSRFAIYWGNASSTSIAGYDMPAEVDSMLCICGTGANFGYSIRPGRYIDIYGNLHDREFVNTSGATITACTVQPNMKWLFLTKASNGRASSTVLIMSIVTDA